MVPARFVYEYPDRCLQLIEAMEPDARRRSLIGSFSLMVAPSLFLIPFERLRMPHPLREHEQEPQLSYALKQLCRQKFLSAEFWSGAPTEGWRLARIVTPVNFVAGWKDESDSHPFSSRTNAILGADVEKVIRVIRNALAHGNIVYLDENGLEQPGSQVRYLAFLSRYEEDELQRQRSETYRMVAVTEEGFLQFLKDWAAWLQHQGMEGEIFEAA